MFLSPPLLCKETQPDINDEKLRLKIREKLKKVIKKQYIEITEIQIMKLIMYMFDVVKGDDIYMVYDGSKSGLNDSLWAPWFALPTIDTMTRWTLAGTWLADNDSGEMFLNFPMHPDLQKYCGVDLTQLFPELLAEGEDKLVGAWLRCAMGVILFPYICTQGALPAKQIIKGDQHDPINTFQWDHL